MLSTRVGLFVGFCLLASVAPTSAECAWVLWSKLQSGQVTMAYEPIRAVETRQRCVSEIAKQVQATAVPAGLSRLVLGSGDSTSVLMMSGLNIRDQWDFLCLPDTVDPRGPKAK